MREKPNKLVKSILGKDFFEILKKSDVYKMDTRTVTNIDEMSIGLRIVPRTVMSFVIANLSDLKDGDNKNIHLPFAPNNFLQITKMGKDSFSGHIYSEGKKINEFTHRSIPGVGLVLMTTFEIYNMEDLKNSKQNEEASFDVVKLQNIINERLMLHSLVARVVDEKLAQRDAVEILIKEKLKQALSESLPQSEPEEESEEEDLEDQIIIDVDKKESSKSEKLKKFLEERQKRKQEIHINKTESITCPDCGASLYDGGKHLSLCICYGEDWGKNMRIDKTEKNLTLKFPKNIDSENIDMFLQTLKKIR